MAKSIGEMRPAYGSEWHLLRFLGRHREMLNKKVKELTGAKEINWLDFGFCQKKHYDLELCGLDFLKAKTAVVAEWCSFWPQSGNQQNWDAVAELKFESDSEWLLVEAKAHKSELKSDCKASERGGQSQIRKAFEETKIKFEIPDKHDWFSPYYQFCNRLAALHFLDKNRIPARLLFIYFLGDKRGGMIDCPKTEDEWRTELQGMYSHIGLRGQSLLENRILKLFLPVCPL